MTPGLASATQHRTTGTVTGTGTATGAGELGPGGAAHAAEVHNGTELQSNGNASTKKTAGAGPVSGEGSDAMQTRDQEGGRRHWRLDRRADRGRAVRVARRGVRGDQRTEKEVLGQMARGVRGRETAET